MEPVLASPATACALKTVKEKGPRACARPMDAIVRAPRGAALPYVADLDCICSAAGRSTVLPKAVRKSGTDLYAYYEYIAWQRSIDEFMEQLAKLRLDNVARRDAACQS